MRREDANRKVANGFIPGLVHGKRRIATWTGGYRGGEIHSLRSVEQSIRRNIVSQIGQRGTERF
jgi:hypothetical protein